MSVVALALFREAVLAAPDLQGRLLAAPDRAVLVPLVVELAHERGYDVEAADIDEGLREGWRTWLERWI